MGIISMLAAISTMNTVFASSSHIVCGMGEEHLLPKAFGKFNKHGVSVMSLTFLGLCIGALLVSNIAASNSINFIVLAASCFWLITYCLIHISVLTLRRRYPDAPRRRGLKLAGIPQILAIVSNIFMIINIDTGEARIKIFKILAVLMAVLIVYALIWFYGVLRINPFKPIDMDLINQGKTLEQLTDGTAKLVLFIQLSS